MKIFLCGDVMTGRGIDQILPHPSDPALYEPAIRDANAYVDLAERVCGPIPRRVHPAYVWGDALAEIERRHPDARLVNLETAVTGSSEYVPKGINYRMNPANAACLSVARIDCCVLSNNHVLDWGAAGLCDTLDTLKNAGIGTAGAGRNADEAERPATVEAKGDRRLVVLGVGCPSSGIPASWAASRTDPGVNLVSDDPPRALEHIRRQLERIRLPHAVIVVSIHWGGNWGYGIPQRHVRLAHDLIDHADVDIVHGHSAHHAKGIEVYNGRLVLYGCGDFVNDYEGIGGFVEFRPDLAVAYMATLDSLTGALRALEMVPFRRCGFRLERASAEDATWLGRTLAREGARFGTRLRSGDGRALFLDLSAV